MHFYGWPFGSACPVTIFVPLSESAEAMVFLEAPCTPNWEQEEAGPGFAGMMSRWRVRLLAMWLAYELLAYGLGALVALWSVIQIVSSTF
jgi:hypothetical protein